MRVENFYLTLLTPYRTKFHRFLGEADTRSGYCVQQPPRTGPVLLSDRNRLTLALPPSIVYDVIHKRRRYGDRGYFSEDG